MSVTNTNKQLCVYGKKKIIKKKLKTNKNFSRVFDYTYA